MRKRDQPCMSEGKNTHLQHNDKLRRYIGLSIFFYVTTDQGARSQLLVVIHRMIYNHTLAFASQREVSGMY